MARLRALRLYARIRKWKELRLTFNVDKKVGDLELFRGGVVVLIIQSHTNAEIGAYLVHVPVDSDYIA